jgi:hypothetical protein
MQLAVNHDPVRYRDLVANPRFSAKAPTQPGSYGHPPSVERPPAGRPWRTRVVHAVPGARG